MTAKEPLSAERLRDIARDGGSMAVTLHDLRSMATELLATRAELAAARQRSVAFDVQLQGHYEVAEQFGYELGQDGGFEAWLTGQLEALAAARQAVADDPVRRFLAHPKALRIDRENGGTAIAHWQVSRMGTPADGEHLDGCIIVDRFRHAHGSTPAAACAEAMESIVGDDLPLAGGRVLWMSLVSGGGFAHAFRPGADRSACGRIAMERCSAPLASEVCCSQCERSVGVFAGPRQRVSGMAALEGAQKERGDGE
jgi:hypothetical protein